MKKLITCFALASLLALGGSAIADIGTIDDVPAATLLLPYFEVDLDGGGLTTLFSINNASAAPALVHVVVWTDLSVHVLDFNVYLTGYDVFTQNLRDLILSGTSPATDHVGDVSPVGAFSFVVNPITGVGSGAEACDDFLPYADPMLDATYVTHLQNSLTGQASGLLGGLCSGFDHGDTIARGYITMDNVNVCSLDFPGDAGYFLAGGTGLANNLNMLWGDYFYVNDEQNFAQGETMVHIEASDLLGIDDYTFYYRYSALDLHPGEDQREGLTSTFATRYVSGGAFDGGTDLLVWRDAKVDVNPFSCAISAPSPFPLGQNQIVIFDEAENPEIPAGCTISPCPPGQELTPFPLEAQRTEVGSSALPTTPDFGWLYLNLNQFVPGQLVPFDDTMQNWVTTVMDANERFSVGYDAIQLDNVTFFEDRSDVELPVEAP
jgi:hypothetical protein